MRTARTFLVLIALLSSAVVGGVFTASSASAHEEREAGFPDGKGVVPKYLGLSNTRYRVVCTTASKSKIAAMPSGSLKTRNQQLLSKCKYRSIQDAINSITLTKTSIYVLPGTYTESKYAAIKPEGYCANIKTESKDPLKLAQFIGSITGLQTESASNPIALSYPDQVRCPHNLNLIALMGDSTPQDGSIRCNNVTCGTQIVGTGRSPKDVVIDNRFSKLNAIRADRVGGIVMRNFTVQQAEFNAVYVLETDGFLIDRLVARGNDEYGILAFASDHGLIQNVDAYYNGDSGIYPGSASDLNAASKTTAVTRYAIEIRNSKSHHNTLGYSGTAGNSVYAHHNKFYDNATGIATDSLFPGHPGLPQDHARWSYNEVFRNNTNYFAKYVDTGVCAKPMKERGYLTGTVCPVIPTPVGTGTLIAGGNYNITDHNRIYDNWRFGTMQFWVPAPLRDEFDPLKLFDTSHGNQVTSNIMGIRADGTKLHNGMDHWWDDQGMGNCWEGNVSSRGKATHNFLLDPGPCSAGGSKLLPGLFVKDVGFLTCSQYDRSDPIWRHPIGCTWFDSPTKPTDTAISGPLAGLLSAPAASSLSSSDGPVSEIATWLSVALVSFAGIRLVSLRRRTRH